MLGVKYISYYYNWIILIYIYYDQPIAGSDRKLLISVVLCLLQLFG